MSQMVREMLDFGIPVVVKNADSELSLLRFRILAPYCCVIRENYLTSMYKIYLSYTAVERLERKSVKGLAQISHIVSAQC